MGAGVKKCTRALPLARSCASRFGAKGVAPAAPAPRGQLPCRRALRGVPCRRRQRAPQTGAPPRRGRPSSGCARPLRFAWPPRCVSCASPPRRCACGLAVRPSRCGLWGRPAACVGRRRSPPRCGGRASPVALAPSRPRLPGRAPAPRERGEGCACACPFGAPAQGAAYSPGVERACAAPRVVPAFRRGCVPAASPVGGAPVRASFLRRAAPCARRRGERRRNAPQGSDKSACALRSPQIGI